MNDKNLVLLLALDIGECDDVFLLAVFHGENKILTIKTNKNSTTAATIMDFFLFNLTTILFIFYYYFSSLPIDKLIKVCHAIRREQYFLFCQ
jgi:hypothetical protein